MTKEPIQIKIVDLKGNVRIEKIEENQSMVELLPGERIVGNQPEPLKNNSNLKDNKTQKELVIKKKYESGDNPIKIHFEIPQELWHRASRYITNYRLRHEYARIAFEEYINRREGRDKRLQADKLKADSGYIQDMIDKGLVKLPEVRS